MDDYKERMVKEHSDLVSRAKNLQRAIIQYEAGTVPFALSTPIYLLREQLDVMNRYCHILRVRAEYEGIELEY